MGPSGPGTPFLPDIYEEMLLKFKISDPKWLKMFAVQGWAHLSGRTFFFLEISGFATD
jgi:hypothetical protein